MNESQFLRDAIEKRLRMNTDYVVTGRWVEAMGLMALPPNIPTSLQHLADLVDDIWHYAGDTSADVTFDIDVFSVRNLILVLLYRACSFLGIPKGPYYQLYTSRPN